MFDLKSTRYLAPDSGPTMEEHEAVMKTNDEALFCRVALDMNGMIPDAAVRLFQRHFPHEPISPLILRGTFIRTKAIDNALLQLVSSGKAQVVSFGAGFDTRWCRLHEQLGNVLRYVEVDFEEVIHKKQKALGQTQPLKDPRYCALALDLEQDDEKLSNLLSDHLDFSIRTIFISECCFMYLPSNRVRDIFLSLSKSFSSDSNFILYDTLFFKNDRFSSLMVENFARRGIRLDPIWITSHQEISTSWLPNWTAFELLLMQSLETSCYLTSADKVVLQTKIILDEYEELSLISSHYFLAILANTTH
jgi:hypothetical protein